MEGAGIIENLRNATREIRAIQNAELVAALVPVARALADFHYPNGITVADVRIEAERKGVLTGNETRSELSVLGRVMEEAGLRRTGKHIRSSIPRSHGNLHVEWRSQTPYRD